MQNSISPEVLQLLQNISEQGSDQSQAGMQRVGQRQFSPELLRKMQSIMKSMSTPIEEQGVLSDKFQSMIDPYSRMQEFRNQMSPSNEMIDPEMLQQIQAQQGMRQNMMTAPQGGLDQIRQNMMMPTPQQRQINPEMMIDPRNNVQQGMRQNMMIPTPQQRQINPEILQFFRSRMKNV